MLLPLLGNALLLAAETMTQLLHRVRLLSALQFNPGSTSHLGFKPVKAKEALVFHAYVQKYRITNLRRWQRMSTAVRWYSCLKKEKKSEINKCMGGWCWEKRLEHFLLHFITDQRKASTIILSSYLSSLLIFREKKRVIISLDRDEQRTLQCTLLHNDHASLEATRTLWMNHLALI